jgi:hypothetical protein
LQLIIASVAENVNKEWVLIGFHDLYNEDLYRTVFGEESLLKSIEHMYIPLSEQG